MSCPLTVGYDLARNNKINCNAGPLGGGGLVEGDRIAGPATAAMTVQPDLSAAWGKASGSKVHPLICHTLDTAAVGERVIGVFPGPRARTELCTAFESLGDAAKWVAVLMGLHDLGKFSPAFQGIREKSAKFDEEGAAHIRLVARRARLGRRFDTPHGLITAMHLSAMLVEWGMPRGTAEHIAVGLGGHHGHFPDGGALQQARREINNHGRALWKGWRDHFVGEVVRLRGLPDPRTLPWEDVHLGVGAAVTLAAVTTISDWIASDTANFPLAADHAAGVDVDIEEYARTVDAAAAKALDRLELRPWRPKTRFAELFPDLPPRPVQSAVDRLTQERNKPTLVLVEAPTGEGKSEAAVQASASLVVSLGLVGAYLASPTQVLANQTRKKLKELLEGSDEAPAVHLVHSNAKEYLLEQAATPVDVGVDHAEDSDRAAQEWFTRKKNLLAAMGAGTIDQALKGAIRSGHFFVRLVALSNKVVVIDEVHAYDTYMSVLLDRLLTWFGRLGVSVVLLSATLPGGRRQELVSAWQSGVLRCLPRETPRLPESGGYPRVTVTDAATPVVEGVEPSDANARQNVRLVRVADDELVAWALRKAQGGGSVAIMHNLRSRAIATFEALRAAVGESGGPEVVLLHGKLPTGERTRRERQLEADFGREGSRPNKIVVSTMVLSHGMDLDFDALATDIAPVDELIQRAGRLHRHDRRSARGEAVVAVLGVRDTDAGPRFPNQHTVYATMITLRTWALLKDRDELELPGEVPALIDAVYGPEDAILCPAGWEKAWEAAGEQLTRARAAADRDARLMHLPRPEAVEHLGELTKHSKSSRETRRSHGGWKST
jgi:CRISPR-associated endonuclease/helicase Cas3